MLERIPGEDLLQEIRLIDVAGGMLEMLREVDEAEAEAEAEAAAPAPAPASEMSWYEKYNLGFNLGYNGGSLANGSSREVAMGWIAGSTARACDEGEVRE
jgi:hypothetical protein